MCNSKCIGHKMAFLKIGANLLFELIFSKLRKSESPS